MVKKELPGRELNPGDRVRVDEDGLSVEGTAMKSEGSSLVIKLDNGYNIGISRERIKKITILGRAKQEREKKVEVKQRKDLPRIRILHTGGTIASRVDYRTGAVKAQYSPDEILKLFPELKQIARIESEQLLQLMSEDMEFSHYNVIARAVAKAFDEGVTGVILTHGTDTMHYTSAALSFMLPLKGPLLLVGSQRSSDRPSSDAFFNLMSAVLFITRNPGFKGVAIAMHRSMNDDDCWVIPGLNARKMHTSRRDAFRPVNRMPLAIVNPIKRKVKIIPNEANPPEKLTLFRDVKVGLLKSHPHLLPEELNAYKGFDGLVIEATGLGHLPIHPTDRATEKHKEIFRLIKELSSKMPVAIASQTIYGRINMNVYSSGRELLDAGVLGNLTDMTPETAFIKMAWLLSNYPVEKVRELYGKNLVGEISGRSLPEEFLI